MKSGALLVVAVGLVTTGCTIDRWVFEPEPVDEYRWDETDPQLEGDLTEPHPSLVPASDRTEGFVDAGGDRVYFVFARRKGAEHTILYNPGSAAHLGRHWDRVERLWQLGVHVLVYDYPGYGRSGGRPSESGMYEAAAAVLQRATEIADVDPSRVWLYGYSLGGAVAVDLARRAAEGPLPTPRGVLTESAFCSIESLLQDGSFLDLEASFVSGLSFDSCAKVGELEMPLLLLHGERDRLVVPRHAKMLYERAPSPAELRIVDGASHSDVPRVMGKDYDRAVRQHLTR